MASNSGTSQGPLDIALRQSPFPQTGSWNMLDIAKLPVQLTVGMLSRYAAARVNPYTVVVAEAMGMTFRMGRKGRANVEQALSKLSAVGTLNHALFIRFGIDDFTRSMVKSEGGAMAVGLCAALRECFHEDTAIEIMLEYARITKADGQWMPSNTEWRSLLNACAGSLSSSNFAVRAEQLMRLSESVGSHIRERINQRKTPSPRSIALALTTLAKLSNGHLESMVIKGRASAGWLAAAAEWFLDLRVEILVEHSGETLYRNHSEHEKTQITVIYNCILPGARTPSESSDGSDRYGQAQESDHTSTTAQQDSDLDIVRVKDKTFRIKLEDITQIFSPEEKDYGTCRGRVPWSSALECTFGSHYQRLMQFPEAFGSMIGCAAVTFYWMSRSHVDFPREYLRTHLGYCDSSYGRGFTNCAVQWFPELHCLREHMERGLQLSFDDAKKAYDASAALLATNCRCDVCQTREDLYKLSMNLQNDEWIESQQKFRRSGSTFERITGKWVLSLGAKFDFCLVIVAETIINLCECLSNVIIHSPDLFPRKSGIDVLYRGMSRAFKRSSYTSAWLREIRSMGQISLYQYCKNHISAGSITKQERSNTLLALFTGISDYPVGATSATWANGISAFSDVLVPSHCKGSDMIGKVHIVAGRIHFEGKSYEQLFDSHGSIGRNEGSSVLQDSQIHDTRTLSIRETSTSLECLMQFISDHDMERRAPTLAIGPAALADILAKRWGLVYCSSPGANDKCAIPSRIPQPIRQASSAWVEYRIGGKRVRFMRPSSTIQALVMMASLSIEENVYIVNDQCENCCVRTALTKEAQQQFLGFPDDEQIVYFVYIS